MQIGPTDTTYYNVGFGFSAGTLGSLTSLTIQGSNFYYALFINPQDWSWSGDKFIDFGLDGDFALGLAAVTNSITIDQTTMLWNGRQTDKCQHAAIYTVSELMTKCGYPENAPIAIWVGISQPNEIWTGISSGTVSSINGIPPYFVPAPFSSIPPEQVPRILNLTTYGGIKVTGYLASMPTAKWVVYNFPAINQTQLNQELLKGNFSLLPITVWVCNETINGQSFALVRGFYSMRWEIQGLTNSTEFLLGNYQSIETSIDGWSALPACK
jgi:hypothetical protein